MVSFGTQRHALPEIIKRVPADHCYYPQCSSQLRLIRHPQISDFLWELTEVPDKQYILTYEVNGVRSEKLHELIFRVTN